MRAALPALSLIASIGVATAARADCDFREPRAAEFDASGATKLVVEAGAGDLRVQGTSSAQVRIAGEACADSREALGEIKIATKRQGTTLFVTAVLPDHRLFDSASLDLKIEVPASMALEVTDSSGDTEINQVGSLKLDDSSGDINVRDVSGDVRIADSSGDVRVATARGDVSVTDSSGDVLIEEIGGDVVIPLDSSGGLNIRRVRGAVHVVNDSSGDITIAAVDKDVVIDNDSSGDIHVSEVRGGLTVAHDSTGDIEHHHVAGSVRVPASNP